MEADKPVKILIVDDEPDMCWTLQLILQSRDYEVVSTTSGMHAWQLIAADGPWAVAFVDAKLPDLDGLELTDIIRQLSPNTTIILVSGYFYKEDSAITHGLETGRFAEFIAKPFDIERVRTLVRNAVQSMSGE